jgi:hypothetical protein
VLLAKDIAPRLKDDEARDDDSEPSSDRAKFIEIVGGKRRNRVHE